MGVRADQAGGAVAPMTDTSGMDRLLNFLVPLLAAVGLLAYEAYQGQLDVEAVIGVGVFLIVAAVVGTIVRRLGRKHRGA